VHISNPSLLSSPTIHQYSHPSPIDLSNLSAEDITAATAAMEATRRAREDRERREAEEWRRWQEEEWKEAAAQKEVEEQKEVAARKAEAERRDHLAQEKAAREAVMEEEQWQSLSKGLSGLTLTPAPSSIVHTASGSSTQSKGKRKVMEEDSSVSQYVSFIQLSFIADFFWRSRFSSCDSCTIVGVLCSIELGKNGIWRMLCDQCWQQKMACHWDLMGVMGPRDPNALKRACGHADLSRNLS
jgi:membrane protein involved in colicin uptake